MNALRHGVATAGDVLLAGEDRDAYEAVLDDLITDLAPATELEGQLVRRLASALWRQHRADRLEAKLFAWTDTPKIFHPPGKYQPIDAEANFDLARLAAIQRYRAEASREASRILRELRQLRAEAAAEARNEPEPVTTAAAVAQSEPEMPATRPEPASRNEPDASPPNRRERRRQAARREARPSESSAAASASGLTFSASARW